MITVITHWFNEGLLAPLFLKHYSYADNIIILLSNDTNDNTREICSNYSNVTIKDVSTNGMDEVDFTKNKNEYISSIKEGWIYMVDADEFIFPEGFKDPHEFLKHQKEDVVVSWNYFVFRHKSEQDIDYSKEPVPQRVHALGSVEFKNWFVKGIDDWVHFFKKPCIFRAGIGLKIFHGCHVLIGDYSISKERYIGAHWKMADKDIAMSRRLSNKARMSWHNTKMGYSSYEFRVTEERINKQLNRYSNLPVLDLLVKNE